MTSSDFWKGFGSALAKVATVAAQGALWASQHPEVVAAVSAIAVNAGAPAATVQKVDQGIAVASQVAAAAQAAQAAQSTTPGVVQ